MFWLLLYFHYPSKMLLDVCRTDITEEQFNVAEQFVWISSTSDKRQVLLRERNTKVLELLSQWSFTSAIHYHSNPKSKIDIVRIATRL